MVAGRQWKGTAEKTKEVKEEDMWHVGEALMFLSTVSLSTLRGDLTCLLGGFRQLELLATRLATVGHVENDLREFTEQK